jgi:hypothetical protein
VGRQKAVGAAMHRPLRSSSRECYRDGETTRTTLSR